MLGDTIPCSPMEGLLGQEYHDPVCLSLKSVLAVHMVGGGGGEWRPAPFKLGTSRMQMEWGSCGWKGGHRELEGGLTGNVTARRDRERRVGLMGPVLGMLSCRAGGHPRGSGQEPGLRRHSGWGLRQGQSQ